MKSGNRCVNQQMQCKRSKEHFTRLNSSSQLYCVIKKKTIQFTNLIYSTSSINFIC